MKKYKLFSISVVSILFSLVFPVFVSANSSWVWISETRPYDILPFVVIGTLLIETVSVNLVSRIGNWYKTFFVVFVGNIISFAVPYIGYSNTTPYADAGYTLSEIINRGPYYTVGAAFLLLTLIIELPVVYFLLKKDADNKKKLALCIVLANIVTTVLVAVVERTLCYGRW